MIIEPFKMTDYAEIELGNDIGLEHWGAVGGIIPILQNMERAGTYCTVREDGRILLIGGFFQFVEGVCEMSFYPSIYFLEHPRRGYAVIKKFMDYISPQYRRIQAHCRKEEKFMRFAKHLGFKREGILEKFGRHGEDHVMMAIVR